MTWQELHDLYGITSAALNLEPRFNIAPTTQVPVIRGKIGQADARPMRWGLLPPKPTKKNYATINARADTILERSLYAPLFAEHRCIVPMSGFFEWREEKGSKQPFYITMKDEGIMSAAGLWGVRKGDAGEEYSFTIITTDGNGVMKDIHDRMPVFVDEEEIDRWLDGRMGQGDLVPVPDEWIRAVPVSTYVSSTKNQGEKCIEELTLGG